MTQYLDPLGMFVKVIRRYNEVEWVIKTHVRFSEVCREVKEAFRGASTGFLCCEMCVFF